MENKIEQIKRLVVELNQASDAYYNTGNIIMDDAEFDLKLKELQALETETGIILSNSPTHNVGAEVRSSINKQSLGSKPMLSLDKCHGEQELVDFAGDDDCYISIKCDGLSTRLSYKNGELISATTRGDGWIGQSVLFHVKEYVNVPTQIPYHGDLIIDGESVILEQDLKDINSKLPEDKQYANCRNLAAGTLSGLDANVTRERKMRFIAWRVIEGFDGDSNFFKLKEAERNGFAIVPMWTYNNRSSDKDNLSDILQELKVRAKNMGLPMDGAVMAKDSITLSESMGRTDKFFRHSIAYKYEDETHLTKLIDIEFTLGKSGILTPTAVFQPVVIDGSVVERASVHNISILTKLDLHPNDMIEVYKANCIIPQIARNISSEQRSEAHIEPDYIAIPTICPVCGENTELVTENSSTVLMCTNPNCSGKLLAKFTHFVSRNCANIEGLSEKTLEALISRGFLHTFKDIYHLEEHKNKLIHIEGLGEKSVSSLLKSIEKSRDIKLENFINALGIPGIGLSASKTIANFCKGNIYGLFNAFFNNFDWTKLNDFGDISARNIEEYLHNHIADVEKLADEMHFIIEEKKEVKENPFNGKTICVTGRLEHFSRDSINAKITELGAKAASSVSKKTDYLITNEANGSSKYKKAVELNVPIITEKEFLKMCGD